MKKLTVALASLAIVSGATGAKKILDHADFDRWEKVTNYSLSNDGAWAAFAVNPQEGDGTLYLQNTSAKGNCIEIKRGYQPSFTADGKWAFAMIRPFFAETRKAKIAKKKDFDLPQDSLAIVNLKTGKVSRVGNVISYKIGKEGGNSVAWLSCDTTLITPKNLKDKEAGRPLVVRNLANDSTRVVNWVKGYLFSKDGERLALNLKKADSDTLATNGVAVLNVRNCSMTLIDRDKRFYGTPVFNEAGTRIAYVASDDSVKSGTKETSLFLSDLTSGNHDPREISVSFAGPKPNLRRPHSSDPATQEKLLQEWSKKMQAASQDLYLNQYSQPQFSYDGKRLIVGVAPRVAPDDTTIVAFERADLDIWRWDAPMTPPKEKSNVEELRKTTYPVVIDLATGDHQLITNGLYEKVTPPDRWDKDWALVADYTDAMIQEQWDYQFPVPVKLKNVITGEEVNVGDLHEESYSLSPADKYVIWFDRRAYHVYDIAEATTRTISSKVPYPLWDERLDVPLKVSDSYGIMGWTENDGRVLVYDRYDVWSLDPKGVADPVCITAGEGRKRNLKMRYIKTDPESRFIAQNQTVVFSLFDFASKQQGLASATFNGKAVAPHVDFIGDTEFRAVRKALKAPEYSWIQGNFSISPNVYISERLNPAKTRRVSNSNPQMENYRWGTAQLFKWHAYDGQPAEGVLYLPEDFNPDEEYPMIAYFYENYTDDLFHHYDMEPSWSWINFPFYVSRGYVIFVPDVRFNVGVPGESSYNYVCSGVEAVCDAYPNIDRKRIGIDGQSWGGYQTAYLITRTNMFACAGSGAPVANMTSAFGGIRWGTGDSRQAQYEVGQSRIGRTLWEAPELYIYNSPVFHADRVHTPLLIMHNDNDGAVPWYQGIEMFMALRRLGKPVWMLQYNDEAHNLKERRNRKDITRRLQQFFDHYLKGDPMPEWMEKGIPATRKGQVMGY